MSGKITLDMQSDNPLGCFMTYCPRCGGEGKDLILAGNRKMKTTCGNCGTVNFGTRKSERCGKCNERMSGYAGTETVKMKEHERVPGSVLCDDCEKEVAEHNKIMAEGGVAFRCEECGCAGMIRKSEFSENVRQHHGEEYTVPQEDGTYKPCGVEFNACNQHQTQGEEDA